ncbi:MAG: prepilin-type N-terminal cleavage/methylation domain-containing protein [Patescibacteria group bacterium]|nr:prepilin-type N-terminal cleavage/methylation domain-containing protein [Patescibacteria group bacterium]
MSKKGFTLVEALIAIAIFVIVGTLASSIYVYNVRNYKYIRVEKELADDAQFIVERIAKEFQDSTIDYEEYYSRYVMKADGYGENYGLYAGRFYNNFGVNTGQNPPLGTFDETSQMVSAATCDPQCEGGCDNHGCYVSDTDPWNYDELYMISGDGEYKTIFKFDYASGENLIKYLKLTGKDTDNDAVYDEFEITQEEAILIPPRTSVEDLRFYIAPIEDPRKAYAEDNLSVQMHPHIMLYLALEPGEENQKGLDKERLPRFEVQTSLSSRVYHEVPSPIPTP